MNEYTIILLIAMAFTMFITVLLKGIARWLLFFAVIIFGMGAGYGIMQAPLPNPFLMGGLAAVVVGYLILIITISVKDNA
jgi:hypothetical protein